MSISKSFAWAGLLCCLVFVGCGDPRSTGEPAPEEMPAEATDPTALTGGLETDSGAGGDAATAPGTGGGAPGE